MFRSRSLACGALFPLAFACQSVLAANGSPAGEPAQAGLLPPATRAIEVQVAALETSNLAHLLDQLGDATGVRFTATQEVRSTMERTPCGLNADTSIPPDEAWLWVEGILAHNGVTLGLLSRRAPHLLAVYMPGQRAPSSRAVLSVEGSRIEQLEEHPALLVVTWLELPHMDVRQLGNSLRALTTDPSGAQSVVPVGSTNSVMLTGMARDVIALGGMLIAMNRVAGETAGSTPGVEPDAPSGG